MGPYYLLKFNNTIFVVVLLNKVVINLTHTTSYSILDLIGI